MSGEVLGCVRGTDTTDIRLLAAASPLSHRVIRGDWIGWLVGW